MAVKPMLVEKEGAGADHPGLCDRCSAETALTPDAPADGSRRSRWMAVAVGLAGAAVALIGVAIAHKHEGSDQEGRDSCGDDDGGDDDLDDESDDFDDFGGFCEDCDDKPWIHYCPECDRSDD
jgi:hypothetical protein